MTPNDLITKPRTNHLTALVLASGSPRRKELLQEAGAKFVVLPSDVEETVPQGAAPDSLVMYLAVLKSTATANLWDTLPENLLILSADTIVVSPNGTVLGKPADEADAKEMLHSLSGKEHTVYTGFSLKWKGGQTAKAVPSTVRFRELTDEEIDAYIATGEPMDKAGAYAIQGLGGKFVEEFKGDFTNIVGLPMKELENTIQQELGKSLSDFQMDTIELPISKKQ